MGDSIKSPRILALYLPQFHRTAENDAWWGEGFTDWTAARDAKPLFDGHEQPHVPLNNNYYDLLSKDTMLWQARLMHEYGVDGMCFYHYYFKDGRRILEKPAENLLRWTDVDMPFCFSWANESWVRSWSNVSGGNRWSEVRDRHIEHEKEDNGLLVEQDYGGREEWEEHFYYLLPFFRDSRYLRQDGKPVFVFYKPGSIGCLEDMTACWRELADRTGLGGLYLVGNNGSGGDSQCLDESYVHEPGDTTGLFYRAYKNPYKIANYLDYDDVWKMLIDKPIPKGRVSLGGFSGYDDSPRRGRNCTVIHGGTPKKFGDYMTLLMEKAMQAQANFVFLNAWNEWGEGMYLEPDAVNGHAYLKALREAKKDAAANRKHAASEKNEGGESRFLQAKVDSLSLQMERYESFWRLLDKMLFVLEHDIDIGNHLKGKGYKHLAIYGMGMIGKHLTFLLKKAGIVPSFAIDQSGNALTTEFPVISPQDRPMEADVIIVTVTYDFESVKREIEKVYSCPIISLKNFLDEVVAE